MPRRVRVMDNYLENMNDFNVDCSLYGISQSFWAGSKNSIPCIFLGAVYAGLSYSLVVHRLQVENRLSNGRLLLRYMMWSLLTVSSMSQQLLALAAVSVRAFRTVAHVRVHSIMVFVWFSVIILTLWVSYLVTNRSACRKNSILVKVCFHAKRGLL